MGLIEGLNYLTYNYYIMDKAEHGLSKLQFILDRVPLTALERTEVNMIIQYLKKELNDKS